MPSRHLRRFLPSLFLGLLLATALTAHARLRFAGIFTDGAVIQQGQSIPVWGHADPGKEVTVTLSSGEKTIASASGTVAANGRWIAFFDELKATTTPATLTITDGYLTSRRKAILIGEVWFCSGQSNMVMPLAQSDQAKQVMMDLADGKLKNLRLFKKITAPAAGGRILNLVGESWKYPNAENVSQYSATAIYFARRLAQEFPDLPIGLIQSSVGETNAYSWTPSEVIKTAPGIDPVRQSIAQSMKVSPAKAKVFEEEHALWMQERYDTAMARKPFNKLPPEAPTGHPASPKTPSALFNGMISPFAPYALRGVIWYQGEANTGVEQADSYAALLGAMADSWREEWAARRAQVEATTTGANLKKDPKADFSFLAVQLPSYGKNVGWPIVRDQIATFGQARTNNGYAVTIDSGKENDAHPTDKHIPGTRLALVALSDVYGIEGIVSKGPVFDRFKVDGDQGIVTFKTVGNQKLRTTDGAPPRHFEIAGKDRVFHPATAVIADDGVSVIVKSENVSTPVAVRYAWVAFPKGGVNLVASELPAAPFRTDDWKVSDKSQAATKPPIKKPIRVPVVAPIEVPKKSAVPVTQIKGTEKVLYRRASDTDLHLYVFKPEGWDPADQRPAVVFFFGGGWKGGTPTHFEPQARYLATRGMVTAVAEYRVKSRNQTEPKACVEDGRAAVRWLRTHAAEWGIDPNRIAAGGGSPGGHVAAATGMLDGLDAEGEDLKIPCKPSALILFNPVYDNGPEQGYGYDRVKDYWKEFSPAHNITADDPPAIVFLGSNDKLIPVAVAERFRAKMKAVGLRSDLHVYEGGGHGFFNPAKSRPDSSAGTLKKTDEFLQSLDWIEGDADLVQIERAMKKS